MSTTATLNSVRSFFATHHMLADEDWLTGCVNYFMKEIGCTDLIEIQNQAKEQWLLNNLIDICPGSLPANLSSVHKTCLAGRFVLQINAVCDIGIIENSIIEMKCFPSLARASQNIETAAKEKSNFPLQYKDGHLAMNKKHNYYYQIQGQLRVTKMKKCFFIGFVSLTQPITVVEVDRDEEFINNMMPQLVTFFKNCVVPEIILRRVQKNSKCKELKEYIGTPAYQQYLKLQKVNTENIDATTTYDEKIPSHRMIKLYMTDGMQEVTGIEYRPMRNLSLDITPGCKILIKGPVKCRRGMLLLTEGAVELLGGDVSDLAANTQAYLVSAKLGLPIMRETNLDLTFNHARNTDIPTPHTQMPPPISGAVLEPTFDQTTRSIPQVTNIPVPNFADDDIDIDELSAIEAQYSDSRVKRALDEGSHKPEKKLKMDPMTNTNTFDYPDENNLETNPTNNKNTEEDYPDDVDISFEDEEYLREMEAKFDARENGLSSNEQKVQIPMSSEPFVYIKQIEDLSEQSKVGRVFKVKGQILKLLSKLLVSKEAWTLKCTIVDGTGCLDVDFTSDVLSKLVGFSPQEMIQLRKQIASKPEVKAKVESALQKAKSNLQELYCIIELTMLETPKITNLTPFEQFHAESLRTRLQASGL